MDFIHNLLWHHDKFLGITWNTWKIIGFLGNGIFFSRFIVQWYATEKRKQVVVPQAFWWLSLVGTVIMLNYAVFYLKDSVVILSVAFSWIPYIRSLIIHRRHKNAHTICAGCGKKIPPQSNYCPNCGGKVG
ncbi:MAG: hypothetical protein RL616_797 [Verrucomicrobiota bacterium]|jgi:lipid-A-disaccharide synthase-like uncharacterized protein